MTGALRSCASTFVYKSSVKRRSFDSLQNTHEINLQPQACCVLTTTQAVKVALAAPPSLCVCEPAGCDYDLKGALCSMALHCLEAGLVPPEISPGAARPMHCHAAATPGSICGHADAELF